MHAHSLRAFAIAPVLFAAVLASGCSEKSVSVTGKLLLPASVKLADTDSVSISFMPVDAEKKAPAAAYSPAEKSFTAKEVPPGKYKIGVSITPYAGEKDSAKRMPMFDSINKTYQGKGSKLEYEVTADPPQQSITLDLDKGTVTKS